MTTPILVQIYKSPRKEEMYLFVEKSRGLVEVPTTLLEQFGEPVEVMSLLLSPERKLARADAAEVLAGIADAGFYLQMPPTAEELLRRDGQP
ncbi:MAG: hypothetical protein GWP63_02100 [Haliea sp.]|jgi:uncharacterized protein YcgL (UPF0745 family)|nr:hypothetical protein [Haliea sp.]